MNSNYLYFNYHFKFRDGNDVLFEIRLDPDSLTYIPSSQPKGDEWTRLDNYKCSICSLDELTHDHCPVALSIEDLIITFRDKFSYEEALIRVDTKERTYIKDTTLQKGLSSILGILMVSSGCPVLDKLRPMVRFHLPLATVPETIFRTTGTYLLGQFFLKQENREYDFSFKGLQKIYQDINQVNRAMAERIRAMAGKDAAINALILLDIFASEIPLSIEEQMKEIRSIFKTYID